MYQRLLEAKEIVHLNMQESQRRQRKWYNKKAGLREGDQVLVLIPTRTAKLLAKWRGPYRISKKIGKINYKIEVPEAKHGKKYYM